MQLLARDSIRILHVEDNNDFAELNALGLRQAGFKQPVVRCSDGLLALHYFSMIEPQSAPHVILLDLHMPGMNGLEVLHWVRQNYSNRDVAVYLLTSSEDSEHMRQIAVDGVTEYLIKHPFVDKLVEKLDRLIAISNAQCLRKEREDEDVNSELPKQGLSSLRLR
jgi:two-component system CitB family response regulator